jgi:hypothetical protein
MAIEEFVALTAGPVTTSAAKIAHVVGRRKYSDPVRAKIKQVESGVPPPFHTAQTAELKTARDTLKAKMQTSRKVCDRDWKRSTPNGRHAVTVDTVPSVRSVITGLERLPFSELTVLIVIRRDVF